MAAIWSRKQRLLVVCVSSLFLRAACGNVPLGGSCLMANNRIDPDTHKFIADCDEKTFCSPTNNTCRPKGCRRDEFPFGYAADDVLPPLCAHADGMFCPDAGSACERLVQVGQPCEMNRDEQCVSPPNSDLLSSSDNSDGAICLLSTCM